MNNQPPSAGIQRGILAPAPSSRRKPPKPQPHPNQQQHTFRTQLSTPLTTSGSTTPHSDRTMSPALMQVLPMPGHQHGVSLSASPIRYDPAAQTRRGWCTTCFVTGACTYTRRREQQQPRPRVRWGWSYARRRCRSSARSMPSRSGYHRATRPPRRIAERGRPREPPLGIHFF